MINLKRLAMSGMAVVFLNAPSNCVGDELLPKAEEIIKKAVKHPMLTAVKIWALAHLLVNWDLGSLILFGSFLLFGVIDRIALKRRGDVGAAEATPNVLGDLIALAVGLALYGVLVYELHYILFGIDLYA